MTHRFHKLLISSAAVGVTALACGASASSISPVSGGLIFAADAENVTLDAGAVSSFNDQSGGAHNALQTGSDSRPTVTAGVTPGGTGALDFDGIDDHLVIGGDASFETGKYTVYAVFKTDTFANGRIVNTGYNDIDPATAGDQNHYSAHGAFTANTNRFRANSRTSTGGFVAANSADDSVNNTDFFIGGYTLDNTTGDLIAILINDANVRATSSDTGANLGTDEHLFTLIGSSTASTTTNATPANFFEGQIAELLIYDRVLTAGEQSQVEGYLYNKHLVPEPGALTLALLGTGLLVARRRRMA